jgi:Spy/CpxP family protein refolding chaperone
MQKTRFELICSTAALVVAMSLPAVAQQPGAPGGGQGRGQGRGSGQRGGYGGRGGGQLTLANVPVEALAKSLSLTGEQKTKIEAIQTKHREEMRAMFPQGGRGGFGGPGGGAAGARPGGPGAPGGSGGGAPGAGAGARPGGPGGPSGPGGGGGRGFGADPALMEKIRAASTKTTASIEAVLNSAQRVKVPGLVKEFQALRGARIPLEVAADLKLTPDQIKKIEAVSDDQRKKMLEVFQGGGPGGDRNAMAEKFRAMRTENQQKIEAILTADQKAAVKKYEDAHPRPQRGGGRGGRGGGGGQIS